MGDDARLDSTPARARAVPSCDRAFVVDDPTTAREAMHRLRRLGAALDELAAEIVASAKCDLLEAVASGRLIGALRLKVCEPDSWRSHELANALRDRLRRGGSPSLEPLLRGWCRLRGQSQAFAEALGMAWHELPLTELQPADWPAVLMLLELSPWLGHRMQPGPVPEPPEPAALRHLLPAQALTGAAAEVLACLSARRHDPAIRAGWWLALACSARAGLGGAALALVPDDAPIGEAEPLLVACTHHLAASAVETAGRCRVDDVTALERVLQAHARHAPSAVAALLRPRIVAEPSRLVDHLESCRLLLDRDADAVGWITDATRAVSDEALATLCGAGTTDGFLCGLLRAGQVEAVVALLERMPDAIGCGGALASMITRSTAVRPRLAALLRARARTVPALAAASFHLLRLRDLGHELDLEAILAGLDLDAPVPAEQRARLNEQLTRIVRLAPPQAVPALVLRYIRPVDASHAVLAAEQERVAGHIRVGALSSACEADVRRHLDPVLAATMSGLPWSVLRFLGYVVGQVGPLDPELRAVLGGRRRWPTLPKTGSSLSMPMTHPGVLIHRLEPGPALVWQAMALEPDDPLPVAPFLGLRMRGGCAEVRSRYCGMTYPEALELCGMRSQLDLRVWVDLPLGPEAPPMLRLLCEMMRGHERITLELPRRGIEHGHPHPRNFTVELMDRQYLRRARARGMTVSTAPYHPEHVSFDLRRAGEREGSDWRWEVVVRLIDLDQIRFTSAVEHDASLPSR